MSAVRRWSVSSGFVVLSGCVVAMPHSAAPAVTTHAASPSFAAEIERARALLLDAAEPSAGVAIAVFHGSEPVWLEGIGYSDLASATLVDPSATRFRIYSVAKPMTATAAARMAELGVLDPGAPIQRYVAGFPEKSAPINAMHLATHSSGIRHYSGEAEASGLRHCATVDEALSIFAADPLLHPPGADETYSSWGFVLLSGVLAGAANSTFPAAMEEFLLEPAGLTSIVHDDPTIPLQGRATFYREEKGSLSPARQVDNTCKWGAGGLVATAEDVGRFGAAMLDGNILISDQSLQLFLRGDEVYRAQGVGIGGTAFFLIDAASDLSIGILSNTSGEAAGPRLQAAFEEIHAVFRGG